MVDIHYVHYILTNMLVYTVWDKSTIITKEYQDCLDKTKLVYPDFQIFYYDNIWNTTIRCGSDRYRLMIMLDNIDDCLYIDSDCIALKTFSGSNNIAYGKYKNYIDNYTIYKPYGSKVNDFLYDWMIHCKDNQYNYNNNFEKYQKYKYDYIGDDYVYHLRLTGFSKTNI